MPVDHTLGAIFTPQATTFCVWAPQAQQVDLVLVEDNTVLPMRRERGEYFSCVVPNLLPNTLYYYRLDGEKDRPDPASHAQPDGVHGPSAVVDPNFDWRDAGWHPPTLRNSVMLEIHVGTYTPEGTFDAIIAHLPRLQELGITTLQLMPVAQFPGSRNWGYDGVQLYCPHSAYGGVNGLKRLVNAAHQQGLAVMLDVVYNHLGPEGNYLWDYGPYFTDRYQGGWGDTVNLDGPDSDHVRRFLIENAIYWLEDYHIDGLRLDAIHGLIDVSARPFVGELAATVQDWAANHNRQVHIIAETHHNDRRLTLPHEANGLGLDGQWLDDLHHTLHVALTGEEDGYYIDFKDFALLPKMLIERYAYTGQYSHVFKRRHGTIARDIPADRFIVATQNHDQVGNRMLGERLSALTDFEGMKLAAVLLACSPYVPMLFMGETYGETAPFLYFVSHGDADLVEAVRKGRAAEFAAFNWSQDPPDPQSEKTFMRSKLNHDLRTAGHHAVLYNLYGELFALRRNHHALTNPDPETTCVHTDNAQRILCLERSAGEHVLRVFMNFDLHQMLTLTLVADPDATNWRKIFDSNAPAWWVGDNPESVAPEQFAAHEPLAVTLPPKGFAIYESFQKEDTAHYDK